MSERHLAADVHEPAPAPLGFADGIAGIGHFLGYLGEVSGLGRFSGYADRVADEVLCRLKRFQEHGRPGQEWDGDGVGALGARLGSLYFLSHHTALTGESRYAKAARACVLTGLRDFFTADDAYDVTDGAAGCVLSLLALHAVDGTESTLAWARAAAEHLLGNAVSGRYGYSWRHARINSTQPLTGFAHGTAGIATALARLHAVAPDPRYASAVERALAYEAHVYDAEARNWPDFRTDVPDRFRSAWCHGGVGIGLARTDLLAGGRFPELRDRLTHDVEAALSQLTVNTDGAPVSFHGRGNHCLCHGDLGNLELMLAGRRLGIVPPEELDTIVRATLAEAASGGWHTGSPSGTEIPGLFTGMAGIGYNLLRLADPVHVPSVLLLHPPTSTEEQS
jgi:lantibiotic modifying enzyme